MAFMYTVIHRTQCQTIVWMELPAGISRIFEEHGKRGSQVGCILLFTA